MRQAYAGHPFTIEILYAEPYIQGLPRYRRLSLNERIEPIIAHLCATDRHLNTSKAWSLPHRASVFSYGMKELSWDIREVTERRQPPNLFGKFIYLPLTHCARRNVSTKPMDPRKDMGGTKTSRGHKGMWASAELCALPGSKPQFTMGLLPHVKSFWPPQAVWSFRILSQKITVSLGWNLEDDWNSKLETSPVRG